MSNFVQWLFGVKQSPDWVRGGRWHLEFQALPMGPWAIASILLLLLLVVGAWWLYRKEGREISGVARGALAILRCLVLVCLAFMLLEVVLVITKHQRVPSHLLVLVDTSQSMNFKDPYSNPQVARGVANSVGLKDAEGNADLAALRKSSRLELARRGIEKELKYLGEGRKVFLYSFSSKLDPVAGPRGLNGLKPDGPSTAVGSAIKDALAAHRGQPLAGMLVVSDAQSNAGEDPRKIAAEAAAQRVVIHTLAAGTEQGPSNVRLADLEASPVVFVSDPTEVTAVVESQGSEGRPAVVTLEKRPEGGAWTEMAREEVTLGEDGAVRRVTFKLVHDALGQFDLRTRVAETGAELTEADNEVQKSVKVVRQRIRVLLVAGAPSPEVQFLRNALMRDRGVELASWLQTAGDRYEHIGHRPIRRLPNNREELEQYDVLILVDPDVRRLSPIWPEMLLKFVGDAGGGLVYVAGENHTQNLFAGAEDDRSIDNSWIRALPVATTSGLYQSSASVALSSRETWTLELTAEGASDLIFRFAEDPNRNREILASLPGMYWHFPVTRAKPGASVLARHGDPRMQNAFGRHVLLATQRYGPGRTVFIGFDSTYRWRYLHEEYFDGFWARLIDRVGRSKVLGGRYPFTLLTDKGAYRTGDRVVVTAKMVGGDDAAATITQLRGEVEVPGASPLPIELEPLAQQSDALEASFQATEAGTYTIRVVPAGAEGDAALRPATLSFRVEPPRQELDKPKLNRALLEEIARTSGGSSFSLADIDRIPDAFKVKQVERVLQYRDEMWDAPILFGGFVSLVTLEWLLRKRFRMA